MKIDWSFSYTIKWIRVTRIRKNRTDEYRVKWEILKWNWHTRTRSIKLSGKYPSFKFYHNYWVDCSCGIRRTHTWFNAYEAVRYWKNEHYLGNLNRESCSNCI